MPLKLRYISLFFIALFLYGAPAASASVVHFATLDVPAHKQFTIELSKPIAPTSLQHAITITSPSGNPHAATAYLSNDATISVVPSAPFTESGTYLLQVQDLKSTDGELLEHTVVQPFTISTPEKATWIWNTYDLNLKYIDFLVAERVTKVYVQLNYDEPLTIYKSFFEALQKNNIAIYVLEGVTGQHWLTTPQDQQQFVDRTIQLQQQYPFIEGIHLDIEPYTIPAWHTNQQAILKYYFDVITTMRTFSHAQQLKFEVDMPFWFDEIRYNNAYGSGITSEFVIDHTDAVTVMAYRNQAAAIIELASKEFNYAQSQRKQVTIAVETLPSTEGDFISFYGQTPAYFNEQLQQVYATYRTPIAVHYLQSWTELLQQKSAAH